MSAPASPAVATEPEAAPSASIGARITDGDAVPGWYATGVYVAVIWMTVAGFAGMVLLTFRHYTPVACVVIASVAALAALPFRPRRATGTRGAHGPALVAVAIAMLLLITAGMWHSQHVLTERDPAVYNNTGRSIARTHLVHPTLAASPFDDATTFPQASTGFQIVKHRLYPNFLNYLPTLLALGWSAGGDTGLLLVPAIVGALALLVLYALGTEIVGPRWALLGPALLTLAPLQSWFSRDAYAELPLEVLVLAGLWLYLAARRGRGAVAGVIAGTVFGTMTFVRVDALAALVAIAPALAVEWLRAERLEPTDRTHRRATVLGFAAATAAAGWIGHFVTRRQTPGYFTNLEHNLHELEAALVAGIVAAIVILAVHYLRPGIGHRLAHSNVLVGLGIAAVVGAAFYLYKIRPRGGPAPKLLSYRAPAAARATTRRAFNSFLFSASFRWFAWYLGTVTLVLIVVGFVVLGIRALRSDSPAFMLLATGLPVTLLYIARPSISPDQLWAMRRYLPVVLPVMTIAAAAAAAYLSALLARWRSWMQVLGAIVLVAAMLVPAARAGRPLYDARLQQGALDAVHEICRTVGPDGAVAIEPDGLLASILPQPVRGFCGVPTAGVQPTRTNTLGVFAQEWKSLGRQLYIASAAKASPDVGPSGQVTEVAHLTVSDATEPARVFGRRPTKYVPRPIEIRLYRVDPA
jgi:hypothetical protein